MDRNIKMIGRRRAFTLIEMLVAMALTVFVMVILSEAFVKGLTTFSGLKAIGDMQENLRVAANNLRSDLNQDHFDGKRRPSDPHFWSDRPRNGFVGIYQQSASVNEGLVDGINSYRATNHLLHMTVKRKGNRLEDFFSAPMPAAFAGLKTDVFNAPPDATLRDASTYKSQWAEVAYFLIRTGTTVNAADTTSTGGVIPVHNLYRLELVVVPDNEAVNGLNLSSAAGLNNFAWYVESGKVKFLSPGDYLNPDPTKRGFNRGAVASYVPRASLVMSDVVSFQVQALFHVPPQEATLSDGRRSMLGNFDLPRGLSDIPPPGVFDTANVYKERVTLDPNTGLSADLDLVLKGVSITIRGWDRGNVQARQTTIIQDL